MDFRENTVLSFRKVRYDIDGLKSGAWNIYNEQASLKKNINDWIIFLANENRELRARITRLESCLSQAGIDVTCRQ